MQCDFQMNNTVFMWRACSIIGARKRIWFIGCAIMLLLVKRSYYTERNLKIVLGFWFILVGNFQTCSLILKSYI